MMSVTQRIKSIKQPHGGYLPARTLKAETFDDHEVLGDENVHPSTMGTAVDILARTQHDGSNAEVAFDTSLKGALLGGFESSAEKLVSVIRRSGDSSSDDSIRAALALVKYDATLRGGYIHPVDPAQDYIKGTASPETIANARTMVRRTRSFFDREGGVVVDGFVFGSAPFTPESFATSGYSSVVSRGDGDVLTLNGLWDVKVSKKKPTSANTLQLVMYYLMGLKARNTDYSPLYNGAFRNVEKLGIFNPRLNTAFTVNVSDLDTAMLDTVAEEVIGYVEP